MNAPVMRGLLAPPSRSRSRSQATVGTHQYFVMPAAFLFEKGMISFNEPPDADAHALLTSVLEGDYRKPFVIDDGEVRRLHFSLSYVQSEMSVDAPYALSLAYTRKMMACLLFVPRPKHIVIVGLGGGSLTKFCYRNLLRTRITTVEIDPDVIAFGELFQLPPPDERHALVHANAVDFMATTDDRADLILLDGCDKHGIAPAFCDERFYRNARARLKPGGMLVMNLVGARDAYHAHLRMLADVFDDRLIVQNVSVDGNQIAFAFNDARFAPNWPVVEQTAKRLADRHGLDFPLFASKLQRTCRGRRQRWGRFEDAP